MSVEEYFAEAADRLQGGEPIERIISDYPREVRSELQDLLTVVEFAEQIAAIAPPRPLPVNRFAARLAFAQRAAELRAELEAGPPVLDTASVAQPPQPTAQTQPTPRRVSAATWWHQLTERWVLPAPTPLMRLAPLTLLLTVTYVLTSTLVVAAKEALPGDPVYPMKLWMLEQGVATAPVQEKAEARWLVDRALAGDVARLAEQLQSTPDAAPVEVNSIQQFRGFDEDQLLIGDLRVIPWHQPAGAGPDEWYPITIEGILEPGATVSLRYQVIPGAIDVVQGIELTVLQSPAMPTPSPTPSPTTVPAAGAHCQRIQPPNWVAYSIRPGESLRDIAVRAQTTSAELRRVNCLTDGNVRSGTTIFVPVSILGRVPAAAPPAVATAHPTRVAPPTVTPVPATPTHTPSPPTSAPTLTPTSEGAAPEPTSTGPGGGEPTSPAQPTEAASSTPNASSTPAATGTPAASPTPATSGTPDASPSPTSAASGTPVATEPPATPTSTPVQTEAPGPSPTATTEAGPIPTEAQPSTPTTAPPTERPADTATPIPTVAVESTPTTAPTGSSEAGSTSTTPTQPPPTQPPPTQPPPTQPPPTQPPPTQPPPTQPPPTQPPPTQPPPTQPPPTQPPPTQPPPTQPPPTQPPPTQPPPTQPPPTATPVDSSGESGG